MIRKKRVELVLIGDFGVGKTSLLKQYLDHMFSEKPSNTMQDEVLLFDFSLGFFPR